MSATNCAARTKVGPCRFLFLVTALSATAAAAGCGPAGEAPSSERSPDASTSDAAAEASTARSEQAPSTPTIRLVNADGKQAFEVVGLGAADREAVAAMGDRLGDVFSVYVASPAAVSVPPMLGSCSFDGGVLRFEPRYPLRPGLRYRADFDRSKLRAQQTEAAPEAIVGEFEIPKPEVAATALEHVYPSSAILPENQLRFYLEFSAPMTIGTAYEHIALLDSSGKVVDLPFLELDEELWDPAGRRFTLLIDPGRIKQELRPRLDLGPALLEGKRYTLVVSRDWRDAQGNSLADEYRKEFEVARADHQQPDPATWQLAPPAAATTEPLGVTFPEPLDYGMLHRVMTVQTEAGDVLEGEVRTDANETRWLFTPAQPWAAGSYRLVVDTTLEDLAGNSIDHPFEVDVLHPIQQQVTTKTVSLTFRAQAAE